MAGKVMVEPVGLGGLARRGPPPHAFRDDARAKREPVAVRDVVPGRAGGIAEKGAHARPATPQDAGGATRWR
jgi:hypothetical protein